MQGRLPHDVKHAARGPLWCQVCTARRDAEQLLRNGESVSDERIMDAFYQSVPGHTADQGRDALFVMGVQAWPRCVVVWL